MSLRTILGRLTGGRASPRKVDVDEVRGLQDRGALLLDVRSLQEYRAGHAPGAENVPVDRLAERLGEIPAGSTVVTICQSGGRSARAAAMLSRHGLQEVYDVRGGMGAWLRSGHPVQRS